MIIPPSVLFLAYFLKIISPFDIVGPLSSSNTRNIEVIIVSWIILGVNFISIIELSYRKEKNKIFLLVTYFTGLILILGPSIYSMRLFSSDSATHLYFVKNIVNLKPFDFFFQYIGYFYHILIAAICFLIPMENHDVFLFIPQTLAFTIYFIGVNKLLGLILEKERKYSNQILLVIVFFPLFLKGFSFAAPFTFLIALVPLLFYNLLLPNRKNLLFASIIIVFGSFSHIFGFLFLLFAAIIRLMVLASENVCKVSYKTYLKFLWVIYFFSILIILAVNLISFPIMDIRSFLELISLFPQLTRIYYYIVFRGI